MNSGLYHNQGLIVRIYALCVCMLLYLHVVEYDDEMIVRRPVCYVMTGHLHVV